jgi:hypothetical protein
MLPWFWYRLCGPFYRGHRWLTDPRMRRYGRHASDCPWCGDHLDGAYLHAVYFSVDRDARSTMSGAPTQPWGAGVQQCPRCHYRWRVRNRSLPGTKD